MKIISGGQTGADREGLEVARDLGYETGGFVPKGWLTENGPDPTLAGFGCIEHTSDKYPPRTRANVMASHGTVWFGRTNSSGYQCTKNAAMNKRPFLVNPSPIALRLWLKDNCITILNVAGNRVSHNPGVVSTVRNTLTEVLTNLTPDSQKLPL